MQEWHALDACAHPVIHVSASETHSRLQLQDAQWQAFHHHGTINRALALHMYETERQPTPPEVAVAVASAARAERHGLTDSADRIAFTGHALSRHPYFDRHPGLDFVWEWVARGELYCRAVSNLDEQVIERIRKGTWAGPDA